MEALSKVKTVEELVAALNKAETNSEYTEIMNEIQLERSQFDPYIFWSKNKYTRNCIACNDDYELMILCWEAGQATPIHDHGGQLGWMGVVDGYIQEDLYTYPEGDEKPEFIRNLKCESGQVAFISDEMGVHRVSNPSSDSRAITLHLYVNPIKKEKIFNDEGGYEWQESSYTSIRGKLL